MAITKADKFNKKQKRTAELAKALSHPARIAILQILLQQEQCICKDVTNQLPLVQSTVSQHLKILKETGIITGEIEGVRICYCIDKQTARELKGLLGSFIDSIDGPNCC